MSIPPMSFCAHPNQHVVQRMVCPDCAIEVPLAASPVPHDVSANCANGNHDDCAGMVECEDEHYGLHDCACPCGHPPLAASPVPLDVIRAALTDEDEIAHGEAVHPDSGRGLGMCAYCDGAWPCRTQRGIDRLLAAIAREYAQSEEAKP